MAMIEILHESMLVVEWSCSHDQLISLVVQQCENRDRSRYQETRQKDHRVVEVV